MVDASKTPFTWGTPDADGLRVVLEVKLGWSHEHTDKQLLPVLQRMSDAGAQPRSSQQSITSFFSAEHAPSDLSNARPRIRKAVGKVLLQGAIEDGLVASSDSDAVDTSSAAQRPRAKAPRKRAKKRA